MAHVSCKDCHREQPVPLFLDGELDAEDAQRDQTARADLEAKGWRFVPQHYVAHDWSGVAGAAGWLCPPCRTNRGRSVA